MSWSNFEALQSIFSCTRLVFILKFNERNIVSARNQTHFFEAWKLSKQHLNHSFVGFRRKVGQKENVVGRLFHQCRMRNACCIESTTTRARSLLLLLLLGLIATRQFGSFDESSFNL